MKKNFIIILLFFSPFISHSQTFSLIDSIKIYDSLEQTNKAILLAHKAINNLNDINSLEAAWIYYYNGVKFLMYRTITGNLDKVDSIKYFAEKSLKIIENKYPKNILFCKNYFLLGGYNLIKQKVELSILNYKIVAQEARKLISPPYIYLVSYKQIGNLYGYLPNKDSSFYYFNKALEANKKYFHSKQEDEDIYLQMSWIIGLEFGEKLKAALKARELALEIYGQGSYKLAQVNKSISDIYSSNKDYKSALSYSIQNIKIYDSLPNVYPEIIIQNDLSVIGGYRNIPKLDSAEYFVNLAINKFKSSNCKDSVLLGQLFFEKGNIKNDKKTFLESITSYKNAENVFFMVKDSNYLSFVYYEIASVYEKLADFENAKKYRIKVLELDAKLFGNFSKEVASDHGSLGFLFQNIGEYKNSKEEYLLEKKIYDKLFPEFSFEQADIFQSLGMAEFGLQNWDSALKYYLKSLEIFRKLGLDNGVDCALLYQNISLYYNRLGDFKTSINYNEKTSEIYKLVYGANSVEVAGSYNSLGSLNLSLSQFDVSKKYYNKALNILKINGEENNIDLAKTYDGLGNIFEKLSLLDSSEYYFLKALKIYESVYPNGNNSVIFSYNELASLYWKKDDKKLALKNKMKSLEVTKRIYGSESERAANRYMEMPLYVSNADSALYYLNLAENILHKINPHHEDLAECYELIAENYFERGDTNAYAYQMKGLEMSIETYGEKSWQVASKYARIATIYKEAKMYKPSIENFHKAIDIMTEVKGNNSEDVGDLFGYLSMDFLQLGEYDTALNYLDEKKRILKIVYDSTHIAWADLNSSYASIYIEKGQYRKSLEFDRKGFFIAKNYYNNESPKPIEFLNDMANSYVSIGRSDTAIFIYNQALDFLRKIGYEYSLDGASVHNNIGSIYLSFNPQDAKNHFLKSVEILQHIHKQFSTGSELYYGNLSIAYNDLYTSNGSKADGLLSVNYADTALMIANASYPEGNIALAFVYRIAGYNFESVNLYNSANKYYTQALNLYIQKFDSLNKDVINTLFFLGRTKLFENKSDSAIILFSKALNLIKKMPIGESETLPKSLIFHNKALAEIMEKKYNEAWQTSVEAISNRKDDWERLIVMMSDKDREKYLSEIKTSINLQGYLALVNNSNSFKIPQELYNNSIFEKGILMEKVKTNQEKISASKDSSEIKMFSMLSQENKKLGKIYELSKDQRKVNKINIDSIEENIRDIERKLSLMNNNSKENISWSAIQHKLLQNESVVDILHFNKVAKAKVWKDSSLEIPSIIGSTFYAALILTSETTDHPKLVFLKNGNGLDSVFYLRYQQYLTNPNYRDEKDWESYQYFWAAIDSAIGDKKIIYVSPDGVYNKINLETLITPDGKYLSDIKDIRIIGSSRELIEPSSPINKHIKNALLVGNPDFKSTTTNTVNNSSVFASTHSSNDAYKYTTRSFDNADISPLPASEKEVSTISNILKKYNYQTTTLIGAVAQEATVKSAQSPSILHIATHGFFEKDIKPTTNDKFINKTVENPMLRSGLLLAGAENTIKGNYDPKEGTENGILTAYEVQQLNLDSTDLVVLSACETGLGEVKNGEGVYGLQRAFRIAGAKSIIMSLWKVDDEATQILMTSFYENWLSGQTKREAFKSAQEKLKKNPRYSHPYYWGAFVLIGE